MGKYLRKAKLSGDVAVVELPRNQPSSLGVRTRSRALALRHHQPSPDSDCYLHLRSRKLSKEHQPTRAQNGSNPPAKDRTSAPIIQYKDVGTDVSIGESVADIDARERSSRESTPCSFIRERTPRSTSRPSGGKKDNLACRHAPTAHEIEEFFADAERDQYRLFMEKYNFDPVSDRPLPGRYEWARLYSL